MSKLENIVRIAAKGNFIIIGSDKIFAEKRKNKIALLLITSSCGFSTAKKIQNFGRNNNIKTILVDEEKIDINKLIGKQSVKVCAITNEGLVKGL